MGPKHKTQKEQTKTPKHKTYKQQRTQQKEKQGNTKTLSKATNEN